MLSVLRLPPAYAKFVNHEFATTPFYFCHLPITNSLKCSPQLHLAHNPCQRNCPKSFLCKKNEQVTHDAPFSQVSLYDMTCLLVLSKALWPCCKCVNNKIFFLGYSKFQGFSALQEDSPWDSGNVWSTLALYVFTLHIPFSFGGLSVVALLSGQPHVDPEIEVSFIIYFIIIYYHYEFNFYYCWSNRYRSNAVVSVLIDWIGSCLLRFE